MGGGRIRARVRVEVMVRVAFDSFDWPELGSALDFAGEALADFGASLLALPMRASWILDILDFEPRES